MFLDESKAPAAITLQMNEIEDTIEMVQVATTKDAAKLEERLNMFVVTDPVSQETLEFSNFEECKRKELEFDTHQQYA